jgi:hypothetical protein
MAYTTINKSTEHFNTKLYTGNGTTNHAITGVGFQPDLNWIKERSNADNHIIHQVGFNAGDYLVSNSSSGYSNSGEMTKSLDSDGFTVGTRGEVNTSSSNYVSWNWLADNTSGSTNSDGSVDSTVSVNTTAGFSIVQWSGTTNNKTIGHGLGTTPKMIIAVSKTGYGMNWIVWHHKLSSGYFLKLNLNNAQDNANSYFTEDPNSSVIKLTGNTAMNSSGNDMIAYCFAEVPGYSKFGSYTGNGSTDGTFVYTGFKPALVIFKSTGGTESWSMVDNKRDTDNVVKNQLFPNLNAAEETTNNVMDFCSNGFKMRNSDTRYNSSSYTYIYMAFGQSLVGSNNVPCTAR